MHFKQLAYAGLAASAVQAQTQSNLTAVLNSTSDLSVLTGLLGQYPALATALGSASNVTLLAPSNMALEGFLNSSAGKLAASDPGLVQAVLMYHVLNGTYYASQITNASTFVHTLLTNTSYANVTGGQVVDATMMDGQVSILSALKANSTVTQANLNFTGGTIHVIDQVLAIPDNVTNTLEQANLTSLAGAAMSVPGFAEAAGSLKDVTVFAPSNEAFQAIGSVLSNASTDAVKGILSYHIISGTVAYSSDIKNMSIPTLAGVNVTLSVINGEIFVNGAKVINPDILIENGVVHVIDSVLNPNNTSQAPNATETSGVAAYSGASSVSNAPFTSGVPTATATNGAVGAATTGAAASATQKGGSGSGSGSGSSSSSSKGAAPAQTAAVGAAALFGGAVMLANW